MKAEDYEIGYTRRSRTLVAMGDDWPDQWDHWLQNAVETYSDLVGEAENAGLDLDALNLVADSRGPQSFAESLGVEFSSEFWEGECISGQFVCGWIKTKDIPNASAKAHEFLEELEAKIIAANATGEGNNDHLKP